MAACDQSFRPAVLPHDELLQSCQWHAAWAVAKEHKLPGSGLAYGTIANPPDEEERAGNEDEVGEEAGPAAALSAGFHEALEDFRRQSDARLLHETAVQLQSSGLHMGMQVRADRRAPCPGHLACACAVWPQL